MRLMVVLAVGCLMSSLPAPATAQEPLQSDSSAISVTGTPVSRGDGAASMKTSHLDFAWGLDVRTGRTDLIDFTGYAIEWSSLRLADGRVLSFAYKHGSGPGPDGINYGRLTLGVPSSTSVDERRVFRTPEGLPRIAGHAFQNAFRDRSPMGRSDFGETKQLGKGCSSRLAAQPPLLP